MLNVGVFLKSEDHFRSRDFESLQASRQFELEFHFLSIVRLDLSTQILEFLNNF